MAEPLSHPLNQANDDQLMSCLLQYFKEKKNNNHESSSSCSSSLYSSSDSENESISGKARLQAKCADAGLASDRSCTEPKYARRNDNDGGRKKHPIAAVSRYHHDDSDSDEDEEEGFSAFQYKREPEQAYTGRAVQLGSKNIISYPLPPSPQPHINPSKPELDDEEEEKDDEDGDTEGCRPRKSHSCETGNTSSPVPSGSLPKTSPANASSASKSKSTTKKAQQKRRKEKSKGEPLSQQSHVSKQIAKPTPKVKPVASDGNGKKPKEQLTRKPDIPMFPKAKPPQPQRTDSRSSSECEETRVSTSSSSSPPAVKAPPPAAATVNVETPSKSAAITSTPSIMEEAVPEEQVQTQQDPSLEEGSTAVKQHVKDEQQETNKSEEELTAAIEKTKSLLEGLIKRPKLKAKLLRRPPFGFLHAIISEIVRTKGFGTSLFAPHELWAPQQAPQSPSNQSTSCGQMVSKADRIKFLIRFIACIAFSDPAHRDLLVTVVPAKILAGADPINTNQLLQALAVACQLPQEPIHAAEKQVLKIGEVQLYSEAIRMREYIIKIQAHVRGYLDRKHHLQIPKSLALKDIKMRIVTRADRIVSRERVKETVSSTIPASQHARKPSPVAGSTEHRASPSPTKEKAKEHTRHASSPVKLCVPLQPKKHKRHASEGRNSRPSKSEAMMQQELEALRKKVEDSEKYLAINAKQQEMVEKALRARQRAEKQIDALANQKDLIEGELEKAVESQKRLANNFMKAVETNKRMEEKLKKTINVAQTYQSSPSPFRRHNHSASEGDVSHGPDDLDLLEAKMKWLEKKEAEVRSLEYKLKQKEAERVQLKGWEAKLKHREQRIEKLADTLRHQRDKLKATQEQAEDQVYDYEVRLKTLDRLTSCLTKQQRKLAKVPRALRHLRNLSSHHPAAAYITVDHISPSIPQVMEAITHENEDQRTEADTEYLLDIAAEEGGGMIDDPEEAKEQDNGTAKHPQPPQQLQQAYISQDFEEMLEHSHTVVDILPQLVQDNMEETESMTMSAAQSDSTGGNQASDEFAEQPSRLAGAENESGKDEEEVEQADELGTVSSSSRMAQRNSCCYSASVGDLTSSTGDQDTQEDVELGDGSEAEEGGLMDWDNFKTSWMMSKQRPKIPDVEPAIYRLLHHANAQSKSLETPEAGTATAAAASCSFACASPHQSIESTGRKTTVLPSPGIDLAEHAEYEVALARLESFLRKRRLCLEDLMPSRRYERIPGQIALRDLRIILYGVNKAAKVYQVLTRNQINLLLKESPKAVGSTSIDQKSFQAVMRKAFLQHGHQTFISTPSVTTTPTQDRHGASDSYQVASATAASSPTVFHLEEEDDNNHKSQKASGIDQGRQQQQQQQDSVIKTMRSVYDDDSASMKSVESALLRRKVHAKAEDIRELEKRLLGNSNKIEGDTNWLSTFDQRFASSLQKLEILRDHSHE